MAEVRDQLVLVDQFSTILDRYVNKMSASAKMSKSAAQQMETANTKAASTASTTMSAAAESTINATVQVSGATQSLIDRLSTMQDALAQSFTADQSERNLAALEQQMKRLGLVWTSTAAETKAAALLTRDSLQELASQGLITANTIAQGAYQETQARQQAAAAAAAEKEAARQATGDKRMFAEAEKLTAWLEKQTAAAQRQEAAAAREAAASTREEKSAHQSIISKIAGHTRELLKNSAAAAKARQSHDVLSNKLLRMGAILFTARRMLRFLSDSLERAPTSIQKSWSKMTNGLKDMLARGFLSMLQTMQPAIDRFNRFMASPAGLRMARGLETAMSVLGQAASWALDKITALGTWIGNNFSTVMEVAGILLLAYAGNMLVAAAATAAANWPLLLLVGLVVGAVQGLKAAGVTAQEVFSYIGQGFGWLYAFVYNIGVDLYNQVATFAEFFANVFNDPLAAVGHLFFDTFDNILSIVETVAKAIDKLTGSNLASAVSSFRSGLQGWTDKMFGKNTITIDRKEKISYTDTMAAWGQKGAALSEKFTTSSLSSRIATPLKSIADNTAKISKNLSDEDLKYIEDVAIRKYERNTNTTLAPQIKVVVQGNADKSTGADIGQAIADILVRQAAAHTSLTTQGV